MTSVRRLSAIACGAVLVLGLAGCGDQDGATLLGDEVAADEQEAWLADWSKGLGLKNLTPEDVAGVIVKDSINNGDDAEAESEEGGRDLALVLVRSDGDWVVIGVESNSGGD